MSATRNIRSGQHTQPIMEQLPNVNCAGTGSEILTAEYFWFTVRYIRTRLTTENVVSKGTKTLYSVEWSVDLFASVL